MGRPRKDLKTEYKPLQKQPEKIKQIVSVLLEYPDSTAKDIAAAVGLTPGTVQDYLHSNRYLVALRELARIKITHLIPKAIHSMEDSLQSLQADVKFRAATKLLESEDIMGPTKIAVDLTDRRSPEELQKIIDEAKEIPKATIQAEVIE